MSITRDSAMKAKYEAAHDAEVERNSIKAREFDRQEAVAADRARIDGLAAAMRAELVPAVVAERDAQWQQSLAPQDPQVARVAALQEALRANAVAPVSQPQVQAQSAFANQPMA